MNNSFEQEPRLLSVLGFVSSESEFDFILLFSENQSIRFKNLLSTAASVREINWSSYKGLTADTLAHRGDEGRGYLR